MVERLSLRLAPEAPIVVIHGPQRTGKTFHAKAFAKHFGCTKIVELDDSPSRAKAEVTQGTLVLCVDLPDTSRRLAGATLIPIEEARAAIGVGPVSSIPAPVAWVRPATPAVKPAPAPLIGNDLFNAFARQGVKLPLRVDAEYVGSVLDGHGEEIFVVDHNNETPDDRADAIAALIVAAVNARACVEVGE